MPLPNPAYENDDTAMWDKLGHILDAFSNAWENAPPVPELGEFIPADHQNIRALALIELVKVDMEYRVKSKQTWRPLEKYLQLWPELKFENEIPPDLILEEARLQQLVDGTVRAEELAARFPDQSKQVSALLDSADAPHKTVAVSRARHLQRYRPGMSVDDFDLLTQLGRGAFATVFLARQNSMQRLVALKISDNQGLEPQTLAQLDHPHIVRVYDQRILPKDKIRLMYMQFIPGGSLAEILKIVHDGSAPPSGQRFVEALDEVLVSKGQTVPADNEARKWFRQANWDEVVSRIGSQLADALDYAHEKGVLHRDLKPANVLVDAQGSPKIVDFNISFSNKIAGATPASYFGGSLAFMSPEQLEATSLKHDRTPDSLDGRSDLYSLGVMLFEMLSNKQPFHDVQATDWSQTVPSMIDVRRAGLPNESLELLDQHPFLLRNAIERTLELDPVDRFQTGKAASRQFEWATDQDITRYLNRTRSLAGQFASIVCRFPFAIVCLLGVTIGLAAGAFIFTYNLIQSVPYDQLDFFDRVRKSINRIAFPTGTILLLWYFWPLRKALIQTEEDEPLEFSESSTAIKTSLNFSSFFAIISAVEWTLAGLLYPIVLSLCGITIETMGWFDFAISHTLTGLSMAAYGFVCLTFLSLKYWTPRLINNSLHLNDSAIEWNTEASRIGRRLLAAQIVAVASPMVAIALLVNLHRSSSSFALGILSVTALIGLVVLAIASQQIQKDLGTLKKLNTN